jgi:hypothetical protein
MIKAADRTLLCSDCNESWVWTVKSQAKFEKKGYKRPIRCVPCQKANKAKRQVNMVEFVAEAIPFEERVVVSPPTPSKPVNDLLRLVVKTKSSGKKILMVERNYDVIVSAGLAKLGLRHAEQFSITTGSGVVLNEDVVKTLKQGSEILFAKKSG